MKAMRESALWTSEGKTFWTDETTEHKFEGIMPGIYEDSKEARLIEEMYVGGVVVILILR